MLDPDVYMCLGKSLSWAVIVAGDHRRSTLGSHVSVVDVAVSPGSELVCQSWVGRAYSQLATVIPPERIIVIGQVKEVHFVST